jgi:hypothetical protein
MQVVHPNGFSEAVTRDRYIMTDPKGRTVIDRKATGRDRARLRALTP